MGPLTQQKADHRSWYPQQQSTMDDIATEFVLEGVFFLSCFPLNI